MRMFLRKKRIYLVLLLPVCFGLSVWGARYPAVVEAVYARGIYPVLAGVFGRVFSLLPFSVAELLLLLLAVAVPVWLVWAVRKLYRNPAGRREFMAAVTANVLCVAGVGYALFMLCCGFGYYRLRFAEQSGLPVQNSTVEELAALAAWLADEANSQREAVALSAETGVMTLSFESDYALGAFGGEAYGNVAEEFPALGGFSPRAKPVILSRLMSYIDIGGIYIPFTFEPNVNVDMPDYSIPAALMHEISHFHGVMREDEANFLAYAACRASGHPDFMYSGSMLALTYTLNALYTADRDAYWAVAEQLSDGVRADFAESTAYWKQFEGPVATAAMQVNDVYLRSNRQESGVKSYGDMVDLLLAERRAMLETA